MSDSVAVRTALGEPRSSEVCVSIRGGKAWGLVADDRVPATKRAYIAARGSAQGVARLDRITTDVEVCHGKPGVRGLRYPVQMLLEILASGMSVEKVIAEYPDMTADA